MALTNLEDISIVSGGDTFYEGMEACKKNFEDLDDLINHTHTPTGNTVDVQANLKKYFLL